MIGDELAERLTLQDLAAEVAELKSRLAMLEHAAGPRDTGDVDLIRAMFAAFGSATFRASEVIRVSRKAECASLRDALATADIGNPWELGRLLGRMKGTVDEFELQYSDRLRRWQIVISAI